MPYGKSQPFLLERCSLGKGGVAGSLARGGIEEIWGVTEKEGGIFLEGGRQWC